MGEKTKIQWCDHTFNCWRGCAKVSPGCANCYADAQAKRNPGVLGIWGPSGTRVVASESKWREPLKWNRDAEKAGVRRRVFCASMADVFEDWTGDIRLASGDIAGREIAGGGMMKLTLDDVRARLFSLICDTPNLTWLLLTKRPQNVQPMLERIGHHGDLPLNIRVGGESSVWDWMPISNVWIGTSVENQAAADGRIPHLLKIPAAVRFLSCEPLLGPVDLSRWLRGADPDCPSPDSVCPECGGDVACDGQESLYRCVEHSGIRIGCGWQGDEPDAYECPIDWVIVGGESGQGSRPCQVEWVRDLVRQCKAASVPVFVKQLGAVATGNYYDDREFYEHSGYDWPDATNWSHRDGQPPIGSRVVLPLADAKGGNPDEWPEDLRIREFPA